MALDMQASQRVMIQLQSFVVRHARLVRVAWLVALLVLAACQPDSNGGGGNGGGGGGY